MVSLGCPKNLVDSEVILGHLAPERFEITADEAEAEIIIINTCAFISDAQEESVDTILEASQFKEDGACKMLIVCGCLPQRYQQELAQELPEVDIFMGTGDATRIVELIDAWNEKREQVQMISAPTTVYDHTTPQLKATPFYTAYVKIAEGCSNCCSYCIIPQLRGKLRSRTIASLVAEVNRLVDAGVKEINLIAQDITAFGDDMDDDTSLEKLLRELVKIEELPWIRLLYAYPDGVSDELIELIATEEKICSYLDLPLQHIDDAILSKMNRRISEQGLRALIQRIRQRIPNITLRTSFIVGFPGETQAQFEKLLEFVNEEHFDRVGAFCYSQELGTPAALMEDQADNEVKTIRQEQIMIAQNRISANKQRTLVGQVIDVLVEGYSEETELLLQGRSRGQAPDVDGIVYITAGQADVGDIVELNVTDSTEYDLIGEMVGAWDE
ncbi:MAG: 30S ribosomal protein S12 methylthiotransferase RimO [Thermodesulfobacteriota bacterium]|nr:30S ribosomal protein S12 methylthiotransferase RimO [Thermodesulfobacteriota bacterium]